MSKYGNNHIDIIGDMVDDLDYLADIMEELGVNFKYPGEDRFANPVSMIRNKISCIWEEVLGLVEDGNIPIDELMK